MLGHISSTQISMFARCQAAWMFRYIWGLTIPPKAKMMRGTCIHRALAFNFMPKVESHEDLPVGDVVDCYSTNYDEESHETEWHGEDKGRLKDGGVRVLRHYQETVAPVTQPVDVEQHFSMDLSWKDADEPKQMRFKGVIDLLTDGGILIDHKSTAQTPKQPRGDHCNQLTGYWLGKEAMDGTEPKIARLDYLVALKEPKIVTFDVPVTDSQKKYLLRHIPSVVKAMEAGGYFPNRGNVYCSETGCGYYSLCIKEFGG